MRPRQIPLDEQRAMSKESSDFLLHPLALAHDVFGYEGGRPAPLSLGFARGQGFPLLGHRMQERFGQFLEDMEGANLMRDLTKDGRQGLGIQGRPIGGHAPQDELALAQGLLEPAQERCDVLMLRIVIEHLVEEACKRVVAHDGQDTERPVIHLVGRDIAGEVR